jgi:Mrp family chromosome partitioning ATPase/capsular polysaccharide biosynthesis protein
MEDTSSAARYVTLRDYLRVLRRYRVAIVLLVIVGGAAGYLDAKRQTPVYEATTAVAFQDPAQDISLVGFGTNNTESPGQLAAENAETIKRPQVIAQVASNLGTHTSAGSIASGLSGQVSPAGLLDIGARSSSPAFAARLANAAAQVVVAQQNLETQHRFAAIAHDTRRQIDRLSSRSKSAAAGTQLVFYEDELARLVTLSKFAKGAQIQQPAQPPTSATSPKTVRSTVIGLVLGLLLGIVVAFFRDSTDRRLHSASDIESHLKFPVIGHVRHEVMGRIPHIANGTGDAYQVDLEAFRILRRNLEFLDVDNPPRSVVVTSAVPDEGKTTVAASLAFTMAAAGRQTLLVDCDLRRPALADRLGIEPSPGMSDYLAGQEVPAAIVRRVASREPARLSANGPSVSTVDNGALSKDLVCIPAGSPTLRAAELLGSSRFSQFLAEVREAYDVVVIDSSPLLPVADTLEMLPHIDGVILCVRDLQTTRDEALAARAALSRFPQRPTGLVVTDIKPHGGEYELYSYSYSYS